MRKINIAMFVLGLLFSSMIFAAVPVFEDKTTFTVPYKAKDFIIKLKSNPTTGYTWFLADSDPKVLTSVGHYYVQPTNKKLMGAPGYELWRFHIKPTALKGSRETKIIFVYARPWNKTEKGQEKTITVTITSAL